MYVHMKQLASLGLLLVLTVVGQMTAAGPDLRLVDAMAERNTALVRTLLGEGVDVNSARADGATALLWAAHWNDVDLAEQLLGAGARVNAADDHGVTPLARACENASEEMVGRLLEADADPNAAQINGLTPLMTAARTGNAERLKRVFDFIEQQTERELLGLRSLPLLPHVIVRFYTVPRVADARRLARMPSEGLLAA